jgi:LysM repeat protein
MEDDLNQSSGTMIPVALAVLAIVLGGAGLYFGLSANQRLNPINESVEAGTDSAARIEKQINGFETRLSELSAQATELRKTVDRLRVYGSQSEQATKQAISGVKSNREELVKLVEKFNELASGGARPSAPTVSTSSSSSGSASTPSQASVTNSSTSASSTYSIQSGDSFAKIAAKKGVELQALLDANPNADPRRLQIGQKINIPAR